MFESHWSRIFGHPEVIITDPGREFLADFIQAATSTGIVVHQTAARAPWQQGKTERHGAHYKEILERARMETLVTTGEEMEMLMRQVEQAKNRYSNRSGFSPIQRQIGQWPRLPAELMSDDAIDPQLVGGMMVDEMDRLLEMRRIAQKAFCEHNAKSTLKKALRSRTRTWQKFEAGDLVYVYRVPKARKKKSRHNEEFEVKANKAMWVGPGTVITPDGANLWISMMGQLWKVAREQCRQATSEEKQGTEAIMKECHELIEEYKKSNKKAGYKDITQEPWPEDEEDEEKAERPADEEEIHQRGLKRSRENQALDEEDAYEPSIGETPVEAPPPDSTPSWSPNKNSQDTPA